MNVIKYLSTTVSYLFHFHRETGIIPTKSIPRKIRNGSKLSWKKMQSNWKHAISWSRGHRSSYAASSGPDTGELRRDFRVAFTRYHRRSLRIARKTNARDCIMCLHECNGAHVSVRGTIPCDTVVQLAVANSWNRTLSVVSFHDFKTLSEPGETRVEKARECNTRSIDSPENSKTFGRTIYQKWR